MATVTISERLRASGKSYVIQYTHPKTGKKRHYQTLRRKADAQSVANKLRTAIDTNDWSFLDKASSNEALLTFIEAEEQCAIEWKNKLYKGLLSSKTYDGYLQFAKEPNKFFGKRILSTITHDEIQQWHAEYTQTKSPASANRSLFIIKQVFDWAFTRKKIRENPVSGISYSNENRHERNTFKKAKEIGELLTAATKRKRAPYIEVASALGAEHGASKQEVIDLKWNDINFSENTIRLFRNKNKVERVQEMMPRTRAALLRWWDHLVEYRRKRGIKEMPEYVICLLNGRHIQSFRKSWNSLCANLKWEDYHFHDNRHSFCTNLLESDASLKDVQEMIGHKTMKVTARYTEHSVERKRVLQKRLATHYAQDEQPESANRSEMVA